MFIIQGPDRDSEKPEANNFHIASFPFHMLTAHIQARASGEEVLNGTCQMTVLEEVAFSINIDVFDYQLGLRKINLEKYILRVPKCIVQVRYGSLNTVIGSVMQ